MKHTLRSLVTRNDGTYPVLHRETKQCQGTPWYILYISYYTASPIDCRPPLPFLILHDLECPQFMQYSQFYDLLLYLFLFRLDGAIKAGEEKGHKLT